MVVPQGWIFLFVYPIFLYIYARNPIPSYASQTILFPRIIKGKGSEAAKGYGPFLPDDSNLWLQQQRYR